MRLQHAKKRSPHSRPVRWALSFPLFYKILIANTVLISISGVVGLLLASTHDSWTLEHTVHWELFLLIGTVSLATITSLSYLVIRAALEPVWELSELAAALRRGESHTRVKEPVFGDRDSTLLIHTVNGLLDELEAYQTRVEHLAQHGTERLEIERRNIARELHDETAQNLVGLLVLLHMASRAPSEAARAQALEEARQLVRITLEGVQRISTGLHPILLDDTGLPATLRWYTRELMRNRLPPVTLDLEEGMGRLPPPVEINLYRIAQEAMSNVARHAQASKVSLSLGRQNDHVIVRVCDDGIGFDPDSPELRTHRHLGLFTIRERARLAGGVATIMSQPGRGTTVEASIPLPHGERRQEI